MRFMLKIAVLVGIASALLWRLKQEDSERLRIGFVVKQPEEPWFQLEWFFGDLAAKQYDFDLIKIGAPDGEKVLTALDVLAAHGAKGVIICVPDVMLGPAVTRRARDLGLKVITVDDQLIGASGQPIKSVHHLGISAKEIGREVGRSLYKVMQERGFDPKKTAAAAMTFDELETARDRTGGAIETLIASGFPETQIYYAPTKTTDQAGGFDAINILIAKHPTIENWLLFSLNDNVVIGGVRALEGQGKKAQQVVGIGINGTDGIGEFRKKEPTGFYGSMLLSAKDHGFKTAEMMYQWIKEDVEPPLDTRTIGVLITRDNYQVVLKDHGISEF